jgi:hypothetical protein
VGVIERDYKDPATADAAGGGFRSPTSDAAAEVGRIPSPDMPGLLNAVPRTGGMLRRLDPGNLEIRVLCAEGLKGCSNGTSNPYVSVRINKSKLSVKPVKDNLNPQWTMDNSRVFVITEPMTSRITIQAKHNPGRSPWQRLRLRLAFGDPTAVKVRREACGGAAAHVPQELSLLALLVELLLASLIAPLIARSVSDSTSNSA